MTKGNKIELKVSEGFTNEKLVELLKQNDININEFILNNGTSLYINQGQIIKSLNLTNENEHIMNEFKEKESELNQVITSLQNEKDLLSKKIISTKNLCDIEKEKELNNLIIQNKEDKDKLIQKFEDFKKSLITDKERELNLLIEENKKLKQSYNERILSIQEEDKKELDKLNDQYRLKLAIDLKQKEDIIEHYRTKENELRINLSSIEEELKKEKEKSIKKMKDDYDNEISDLKKKINELYNRNDLLENEKTKNITSFIEQGRENAKKELDTLYSKELSFRLENIQKLEKEKYELKQEYLEQINELKEYNKIIQAKFDDSHRIMLESKLEKIDSTINQTFTKYFRDNTSKGIFGENFIESYLSQNFKFCELIDTSKLTASGDFLFKYNNLKLLVESKNVQIVKKEEIDKFYRDIDEQTKNGNINSAIFISMHDTNIGYDGSSRNFVFEVRNNIPIIFISNVLNNHDHIGMSIMMLDYVISQGFLNGDDEDEESTSFIIQSLYKINTFIQTELKNIEKEKKCIDQLLSIHNEKKINITEIFNVLDNVFKKYPSIQQKESSNSEQDESRFNLLIELLIKHKNTFPHFKLSADSIFSVKAVRENNYTQFMIKQFKMKTIKEAFDKAILEKVSESV